MKLLLLQEFSIEVPHVDKEDELITGTLAPLNKKQLETFKAKFKEDQELSDKIRKKQKELIRLNAKNKYDKTEDFDKQYKLEDEIEALSIELKALDTDETTSKLRFDMSVESKQLARLIEIAAVIGYRDVFDTISIDIDEKKGNAIPA